MLYKCHYSEITFQGIMKSNQSTIQFPSLYVSPSLALPRFYWFVYLLFFSPLLYIFSLGCREYSLYSSHATVLFNFFSDSDIRARICKTNGKLSNWVHWLLNYFSDDLFFLLPFTDRRSIRWLIWNSPWPPLYQQQISTCQSFYCS